MIIGIGIFLAIVFVTYMVLTDRKVGTTFSISNSWNEWRKIKKEWAFVLFLLCISIGLLLLVQEYDWKHSASPWLLVGGASCAFMIGAFANFRQSWRDSMWHNIFSVLTFASVLIAFFIQGVTFPLFGFLLTAVPLALIKIDQKTTVVEAIGIGLSIAAIFYL